MKKRRTKKRTAAVVSAISDQLENSQRKVELATTAPAMNREAAAAKSPAGKVREWARRVVLGYDRNT